MGRIKTQLVKRTSKQLVKEHGDQFKTDFKENKKTLGRFAEISSPKLKNVIAGYITRLIKTKD